MTLTAHRVQGLGNDEVAADWPPISDADIDWLRTGYPQLQGTCRVAWHSPRPLSAAALIDSCRGQVFVKRHHRNVRTAAVLREEHHFIEHLASAGVPVVQVLRDRRGDTAVEHGEWSYELQALGAGEDLYRDVPSWTPPTDLQHAWDAGRMLALLHRAAADYRAPQRSTHMLVARDDLIRAADPIALLKQQIAGRPGLASYLSGKPWEEDLRRCVLPWHTGLAQRLQAEPRLWAHNDWHVSNLLWSRHGDAMKVATVLDFGLASPTSALFDLATAMERNAVAWLEMGGSAEVARVDVALALLDGYRSVLHVPAQRMQLLADMLPLVHLDFALSEIDYFQGVTGSTANADVAYHTFLLGHAEWFNSADGRRLADALRTA